MQLLFVCPLVANPSPYCVWPAGSIGTQTLDIIAEHGDRFELVALAAGGNVQLLAQQVRQFQPALVAVRDAGACSPPLGAPASPAPALERSTLPGKGHAKPRHSVHTPRGITCAHLAQGSWQSSGSSFGMCRGSRRSWWVTRAQWRWRGTQTSMLL